jgi:hypothetical protein
MKRIRCFCRCSVVFVGVLGLSLLAASAWAGQQEASIVGQVTDQSGGALPGVTVTATSPALQLPELAVITNEQGEYRLSPLPIGTYTVSYTLSGFQTLKRENIQLTLGFVAKIDEVMKVGSLEESITVSGASPLIDAQSTGATTELTRATLESVPSTRNGLLSLMAQAPGSRSVLDLGGNNFAAIPTFHGYGQTGEQWTAAPATSSRVTTSIRRWRRRASRPAASYNRKGTPAAIWAAESSRTSCGSTQRDVDGGLERASWASTRTTVARSTPRTASSSVN